MKTRAIVTWGAAAALSVAALAGAQPARGPAGGRQHPMMGRLARVLDLTEEQRTAFRNTMEQQQPQRQALHKQMRDTRDKLRQALEAPNPDPAAVGALVIQEHKLRDQAKTLRDQADQSLRALLTPEQQAKFDVVKSLRPEPGMGPGEGGFMGRGMGRRGPVGPPPAEPESK